MRTIKEIEGELNEYTHKYRRIKIELMSDIRELLIQIKEDVMYIRKKGD